MVAKNACFANYFSTWKSAYLKIIHNDTDINVIIFAVNKYKVVYNMNYNVSSV